jgi:hypothetical protein
MTYTFTEDQLNQFTQIISGLFDYEGTHDSPPEYEEWLEQTFGEDWFDYASDCRLYENEFDVTFYYGLVTGNFTQDVLEWIDDTKKQIEEFIKEDLVD